MITVHQLCNEFGEVTILCSRATGSFIYCQGGSLQSEADSHGVSLASYVHAIHGLLIQSGAKDVLLIGCGGGTLATMLSFGDVCVTVIDVNPMSVILAKKYFSLPDSVSFHLGDGDAFLRETDLTYDAIVVDAFIGNKVPDHFQSENFLRTARKQLSPSGLVLFNVHLSHDFDPQADLVGMAMEDAGLAVRILDAPGVLKRNAIVLGGAVAALRKPDLTIMPEHSAELIAEQLAWMSLRPCRNRSDNRG